MCGNLKPCRRKSLSLEKRWLIKKSKKVEFKIWQNKNLWYIKNHAAKSWRSLRKAELKKILKNFANKFDKLQNCDILNLTPQFADKRAAEVEIKKFEKVENKIWQMSNLC